MYRILALTKKSSPASPISQRNQGYQTHCRCCRQSKIPVHYFFAAQVQSATKLCTWSSSGENSDLVKYFAFSIVFAELIVSSLDDDFSSANSFLKSLYSQRNYVPVPVSVGVVTVQINFSISCVIVIVIGQFWASK